jgi:hypothetical protein
LFNQLIQINVYHASIYSSPAHGKTFKTGSQLNNSMEDSNRYAVKAPSRGGARENAGRPAGSTHKVTAKLILERAESIVGKPLVDSLLEGYRDTIVEGDRKHRVIYEKILIDKVATTLFDVEVTESEDAITAKREAFAAALAQIATEIQNNDNTK